MERYGGYHYDDVMQLIEENGGMDTLLEFAEGTLLDNYLWFDVTEGQYVCAIERALNSWTSGYWVYFGTESEIYRVWDKLLDDIDEVNGYGPRYTEEDCPS